jgi:hypothetical protein
MLSGEGATSSLVGPWRDPPHGRKKNWGLLEYWLDQPISLPRTIILYLLDYVYS